MALGISSILFVGACDKLSCHSGTSEAGAERISQPESVGWVETSHLGEFIPKTARTVVFARSLATMTEALEFGSARLPKLELEPARQAWKEALGVDLLASKSLEELGVSTTEPAALFYDRGYWVVAASLDKPEALAAALPTPQDDEPEGAKSTKLEVVEQDFGSMNLQKLTLEDARSAFVAHDDTSILLAVRVHDSALGSADTLPDAWLPASVKSRFGEDGMHRKLLRDMSPFGEIVAVVRPAAWLANREADGHAGVLLERILSQTGPIGVAASSVSLDEALRVRVFTPGNPRTPVMIRGLGQAEGDIPPVGGLVEPGVLGAFRLSVEPNQLYALMLSAMPAARRTEVDAHWDRLDQELRINARRDVLENLRGHAVVVAYGLDREALEASEAPWYLDLAKLQATREAVLLPIREREPLEQVLNGLTTISKGKLTRQKVGHTLQYAWLDEGELQWAVILSDEHLIFVDSSVAFDHAVSYERSARPLGEKFEKIGVSRIFDREDAAGLYLDTASLASILAEAGQESSTGWVEPFRSVVVTTRDEGSMGVTQIDLEIAPE
jgi:hypothetical protein